MLKRCPDTNHVLLSNTYALPSIGLAVAGFFCNKTNCSTQSLRGATGGVDTVNPDFLVMDSRLMMPPMDALLPSDSCVDDTEAASCRLHVHK